MSLLEWFGLAALIYVIWQFLIVFMNHRIDRFWGGPRG